MKYKEFLQTIETEIKKKLEDGYSLKIHPVKKIMARYMMVFLSSIRHSTSPLPFI